MFKDFRTSYHLKRATDTNSYFIRLSANKIADVQPNDDLCYQPCGAVLFPCEAVTDGPPRSTCNFTCTQCGFNRGECVQDDKCCCRSE